MRSDVPHLDRTELQRLHGGRSRGEEPRRTAVLITHVHVASASGLPVFPIAGTVPPAQRADQAAVAACGRRSRRVADRSTHRTGGAVPAGAAPPVRQRVASGPRSASDAARVTRVTTVGDRVRRVHDCERADAHVVRGPWRGSTSRYRPVWSTRSRCRPPPSSRRSTTRPGGRTGVSIASSVRWPALGGLYGARRCRIADRHRRLHQRRSTARLRDRDDRHRTGPRRRGRRGDPHAPRRRSASPRCRRRPTLRRSWSGGVLRAPRLRASSRVGAGHGPISFP